MTSSAAARPDIPPTGTVIASKYQVEDILGAGGMGIVVGAHHLVLRQRVAMKFLHGEATRLPEANARFFREARAAAAIQSEHVARVLDVGTLESGAPYIVMEYLAGSDVSKLLKQHGPMPFEQAVDIFLQASEAVAEAHALGIVHRDLKPSNLFISARTDGSPIVKVLDFGLSKITAEQAPESSLTTADMVIGSPHYMSPEQVRSLKHIDWRTDIWAMGVIFYELLTGRRPFEGTTLTAVCAGVIADSPPPLRTLRAQVPEGLAEIVHRCLEKDVERRPQSLAEVATALVPFAWPRSLPSIDRVAGLTPFGAARPRIEEPASIRAGAASNPEPYSERAPASAAPLGSGAQAASGASAPQGTGAWTQTGAHRPHRSPATVGLGLAFAMGLAAGIGWLIHAQLGGSSAAVAPPTAPEPQAAAGPTGAVPPVASGVTPSAQASGPKESAPDAGSGLAPRAEAPEPSTSRGPRGSPKTATPRPNPLDRAD